MRGNHEGEHLCSGRVILLIGAPGSGKGTQSSLLQSKFGFICISIGSILRRQARQLTPLSSRLRKTMAAGALVDDATVCQVMASHIGGLLTESHGAQTNLILDGFPRTVEQARYLDRLLEDLGMPGPVVLHLDVPREVLLQRLARRRQCPKCATIYSLSSGTEVASGCCPLDGAALVERDDDNEGVISRRLAAYQTETVPVLDYYLSSRDSAAAYQRIDGNRGAAEIAKELCDIVASCAAIAVAA